MKFVLLEFNGEWADHLGHPEKNFKMTVYGASGQGKTDYVVQLAKYLTNFGKVYYNSHEEGVSRTLQRALERHNMAEVNGKIIFGKKETYTEVYDRMGRRNSPQFCIIDSVDFMRFTFEQYQELTEDYPHKSFIFISWAAGKRPKTQAAKDIEYSGDIKVRVHEKKAIANSRFGGMEDFIIWPEYWEKKKKEAEAMLEASRTKPAPITTTAPRKRPSAAAVTIFEADEDDTYRDLKQSFRNY